MDQSLYSINFISIRSKIKVDILNKIIIFVSKEFLSKNYGVLQIFEQYYCILLY